MAIQQTLIINLPRRRVRREHMTRWVPREWSPAFLDDVRRTWDADQLPCILKTLRLFPWKIDSENPWWNRPLKYGEIACLMSHMECWQHVMDTDLTTLILEDDTLGNGDFMERATECMGNLNKIDKNWELAYFGRVAMATDLQFVQEGILRPGYSHCTYAYAIKPTGARALLDSQPENKVMPVDEFIPAHYCDHPREDVRAIIRNRIIAYAFQPEIVSQLSKNTWGSDTEDSDFTE